MLLEWTPVILCSAMQVAQRRMLEERTEEFLLLHQFPQNRIYFFFPVLSFHQWFLSQSLFGYTPYRFIGIQLWTIFWKFHQLDSTSCILFDPLGDFFAYMYTQAIHHHDEAFGKNLHKIL